MWPGMLPPASKPAKTETNKVPTACISRYSGESWCGRSYSIKDEFVFQDAPHAVRHYTNCTFLRACPKCVENCKDRLPGVGDFIKHFATRDLENNK